MRPRPRPRWLAALLVIAAAQAVAAPPPVALEGTWHVLVHYRDAESAHPEAMRWDDRVWVFAREGDRLRWTEYPIVVFQDDSGRFEWLGTNRQSRVVHAWEPSPAQRAQIRRGLEVNPRGSTTKTLGGSEVEGWRSDAAARPTSASVITYSVTWSIMGLGDLPLFTREDFLSSARAVGLEGLTEYRTEAVLRDGDLLRGSYQRDGTRSGTFRMVRAGPVEKVKGSGKTQGERVLELFLSQAGVRLEDETELDTLLGEAGPRAEIPDAVRQEVRREIRTALEDHVRAQGESPARLRPQIESLVRQIEHALLDEGKTVDEVRRMLEQGRLVP